MAETADSGFHVPGIGEFFPPAIFFEGTPFEFNRIMLVRVVVTILLLLWLWLATRHAKLVPTRAQSVVELMLDFVRVQIAESVLGKVEGRRFLPMLTTLFFLILAMNLAGVVPFLNIAGTSVVGLPVVLAIWVYITYLVVGLKRHGVGYLKASLFPSGVPPVMYLLITPIEFLQVFILRPLTLALRLLANMMAGHLMLVLCFAATQFLLFEGGGLIKLTGALTFVGGLGITLFEIFVGFLQAFIFTLLAAVYIQMSLEEEH
ncbi:ATP synthase F0 subcomplex A subunit [Serinibacter salmoneus]|uniref:ATP synthase subunit a n=2 Tax=Serinibacter salmoneus TaxID=556530 RepID=A0A2A9D0V4_9MICO|nr:ATP synthase F0 subcomplex A subunit [Serinibacter salmoneus]